MGMWVTLLSPKIVATFNNLIDIFTMRYNYCNMIEAYLKTLTPEQITITAAACIYILTTIGRGVARSFFKKADKLDELIMAVRELTLKLEHFSARLVSTEQKLDKHEEVKNLVWKLERDITHAHEKIRDLKAEM